MQMEANDLDPFTYDWVHETPSTNGSDTVPPRAKKCVDSSTSNLQTLLHTPGCIFVTAKFDWGWKIYPRGAETS